MTIFFALSIIAWLIVMIYMAPAVWSVMTSRVRRGDPARVVCFFFGLCSVAGGIRWLIAPDDTDSWMVIYALNIGVALLTLLTAKSYGRGGDV